MALDFETDFVLDLSLPISKSDVFDDHENVDSVKQSYKKSLIKRYCKLPLFLTVSFISSLALSCPETCTSEQLFRCESRFCCQNQKECVLDDSLV